MGDLIISTLPEGDSVAQELVKHLRMHNSHVKLIETAGLKISHCIGCNHCWIKTPGICCIKDDYESILIEMLQADTIVFVGETSLGFVNSHTKNLFDRILPMASMHLKFKGGQMRHLSRYGISLKMALLYKGEADQDFLCHWLHRVVINLHGETLGAFPISKKEELYHALGCH